MNVLRLLCTLTVAAALSAPACAQAAGPASHGVQITDLRPSTTAAFVDRELDLARQGGFDTVRAELQWGTAEPAPGKLDEPYLRIADHLLASAKARGLRVVLVLLKTPCWATTAPASAVGDCSTDRQRREAYRYPPRESADFTSFVARIAARFGDRLFGYEIWNEPDQVNESFFAGPDKPRRYAELLKGAHGAIKGAAPGVKVLGGALVGANGAFLQELYDAGIKGHYDLLSVHFYDLVLASLRAIHETQVRNGDATPVWLGEFGWASCFPAARTQDDHVCVTRADQARFVQDVVHATRSTSWLSGLVLFNVQDSERFSFGLTDAAGRPKPLLAAMRATLDGSIPGVRKVTLRLRRARGRIRASGSGPVGDAYELNVRKGGRLRYKAVLRQDRAGRFDVLLPRSLGTRGLTVRAYQYWSLRGATRRT